MTTISVSDFVNERLDAIRDGEEHSSKDSVLRELLRAYERVPELERQLAADNRLPHEEATVAAYHELGLSRASPVPRAVHTAATDAAVPLFRLYAAGSWTYNEQHAQNPPWLDVGALPDGVLFQYHATATRTIEGHAETPDTGDYVFALSTDHYEDELLAVLREGAVEAWLAQPGGIPFEVEFEHDGEMVVRPTFGGWGRAIDGDEAQALYELPTVTDALEDTPPGETAAGVRVSDPEDVESAFVESTGEVLEDPDETHVTQEVEQ